MIRIKKGVEPEILSKNREEWTREFERCKASGSIPDSVRYRYRHPEIKSSIKQEAADKCAYCESKVTHVSPGDIEHVLPASKRPDLAFDWQNLVLACNECNRRKSDYYDPVEPLIHPIADDPSLHLRYFGPQVWPVPGSHLGRLTTDTLKLNRTPLLERRLERIERLHPLLEQLRRTAQPRLRKLIVTQIELEAAADKEFSALVQGFVKCLLC